MLGRPAKGISLQSLGLHKGVFPEQQHQANVPTCGSDCSSVPLHLKRNPKANPCLLPTPKRQS